MPPKHTQILGTVLRRVREERRITREVLAVRAGLSVGTLARLELGSSDPTWSTIAALAHALELSLEDLGALVEADEDARERSP
ncbi:MAG TPA: helix-turn-helix transcriptional regulator [Solirubrobacteraceae bacterium]|nr:helix-turn-helix transcriptional regulator [Solirubrobacteraceae bacterium]